MIVKKEQVQRKSRRNRKETSSSLNREKRKRSLTWADDLKSEKNEFRRKLLFIGYLFNKLSKLGVTTYLVGGQAVEIYTGGQFSTGDIDITASNREKTSELLLQMGFLKTGMIWLSEDLGLAVQIVDSYPSRTEKTRKIVIEGRVVNVVGVEDLIIDRLVAAKYWRSNPKLDMEQAAVLLSEFRDGLDLSYLEKRANEEKVADYLRLLSDRLGEQNC